MLGIWITIGRLYLLEESEQLEGAFLLAQKLFSKKNIRRMFDSNVLIFNKCVWS